MQISAGGSDSCAVLEDGSLRCWRTTSTASQTVSFGGLRTHQISLAGPTACAVLQGGLLRCWDTSNLSGATTNIPTGAEAILVSTASTHTCAVLANGSLRCWGDNGAGQLGLGHTRTVPFDAPLADSLVDTGNPVARVSTTVFGTTCAQLQNGSLRCWGFNGPTGQLGYRHLTNIGALETPARAAQPGGLGGSLDFGSGRTVLAVYGARCAMRDGLQLFCWGSSNYGEQGTPTFFGTGTGARAPVDIGPVQLQ